MVKERDLLSQQHEKPAKTLSEEKKKVYIEILYAINISAIPVPYACKLRVIRHRCSAQACRTSARCSFLSSNSAGVSVPLGPEVFLGRFNGSTERRSDFVEAIVEADFIDMVSFSERLLVLA